MNDALSNLPPAECQGWHFDPVGSGQLRYFDGSRWTDQLRAAPEQVTPAGWYPDPDGTGNRRFFDGAQWTPEVRTVRDARAERRKAGRRDGFPWWRKATWALVVWSGIIAAWAIGGAAGNDCGSERTELNQSACKAGTGLGVAFILFIGFCGFVILALIWLMTRPARRVCPACGVRVKEGLTRCPGCGHDFADAANAVK